MQARGGLIINKQRNEDHKKMGAVFHCSHLFKPGILINVINYIALWIFPAFMQREHTLTRFGEPFSMILILWILGRHFLLVLILE